MLELVVLKKFLKKPHSQPPILGIFLLSRIFIFSVSLEVVIKDIFFCLFLKNTFIKVGLIHF